MESLFIVQSPTMYKGSLIERYTKLVVVRQRVWHSFASRTKGMQTPAQGQPYVNLHRAALVQSLTLGE